MAGTTDSLKDHVSKQKDDFFCPPGVKPLLLVVEDERLILDLLKRALLDAGFEVVTADDGTQAMAELNLNAARFKAVITDIRLGTGPDGWEVSRRSRKLVSDMAVIYMTGDSGHAWQAKGVPGSVLVSKPFTLTQIVTVVSTILAETDGCRASIRC